MKFLVAIKRVIDPYVKIRIKPDETGVDSAQVKMSMNPFDEIAVEEAIRWYEKQVASEVVLVSVGNDSVKETLRHGLALGAHRAILVLTEKACNPLKIAKILQAVVAREKPEVVLMGKQSIDGDNNQTPQMLAALNNWPQATFVSKLEFEGQCVTATREVDAGLETLSIQLPAVISTDLRLNQPRYASLPNIMKAKQKPLQVIALEDFGIIDKQVADILSVKPPLQRSKGVLVQSVAELVDKLKQEAKVL